MLPDRFHEIALAAAIAGMRVVRPFQVEGYKHDVLETKADETFVTACDRTSQRAIFNCLGALAPDAVLIGEEKTTYACPLNIQADTGQDGWLVDPLDGTSALGQGLPTPTVVVAYRCFHEVIGCVIGEPISGRMWSTSEGKPCVYHYCNPVDWIIEPTLSREVKVWEGKLGRRQSTVYYDVSHGWGPTKTTDEDMARVFGNLNKITNVLAPGSNALMQALIANGGLRMAGSLTTAKGGPWDLAGVRLVLAAGGYACGFARTEGGWQETNALDVDTTDVLICANSQQTLNSLRYVFLH